MTKLAKLSEIPDGKPLHVELEDGRELALFKIDGKVFALKNACPHQQGPLAEGEIDDNCVVCPWHGWEFDIRTGACINMPGDDAKTYPLRIEGKDVYLDESGT